jgi:hypothetical protein
VQITAKTKTTRPRDGHESAVTGLATDFKRRESQGLRGLSRRRLFARQRLTRSLSRSAEFDEFAITRAGAVVLPDSSAYATVGLAWAFLGAATETLFVRWLRPNLCLRCGATSTLARILDDDLAKMALGSRRPWVSCQAWCGS